jgi:hypothetical protein
MRAAVVLTLATLTTLMLTQPRAGQPDGLVVEVARARRRVLTSRIPVHGHRYSERSQQMIDR